MATESAPWTTIWVSMPAITAATSAGRTAPPQPVAKPACTPTPVTVAPAIMYATHPLPTPIPPVSTETANLPALKAPITAAAMTAAWTISTPTIAAQAALPVHLVPTAHACATMGPAASSAWTITTTATAALKTAAKYSCPPTSATAVHATPPALPRQTPNPSAATASAISTAIPGITGWEIFANVTA